MLLDADIRRSIYVKRYGVDQKVNGLSQYLSGQIGRDLLVYQTNYANMDVIFAGSSAPNPSELLSDALFDELLKEKEKNMITFSLIHHLLEPLLTQRLWQKKAMELFL